jgi:predicted ATP-grasp superfamily ATP-dependent carboligase
MAAAAADDFARLPHSQVHLLADARLSEPVSSAASVHRVENAAVERALFFALAAQAAGTLVIAPEICGALAERVAWVAAAGGRLLGPDERLVRLAADKHQLAEWLRAAGVSAPMGRELVAGESPPAEFPYPAVIKPLDGAGSQQTRRIDSWRPEEPGLPTAARLEAFYPGLAASVAVLCGPRQRLVLPACAQHLSDDGRFEYLGGALPLRPPLAKRAESLALAAVAALPEPRGYLGVDLVLGADPGGRDDVVIEINPRLTTSYVGLRAALSDNLMATLVDVLAGRPVELSRPARGVQFNARGETQTLGACRTALHQ